MDTPQLVVSETGDEVEVLKAAHERAQRGQWRDAAEILLTHQAAHILSTEARAKLAYYLSRGGAFRDAAEIYRALLAENPSEAKWHYGLGYQFHVQERWREAIDSYERALQLAPRYLRVARRLADAYVASGQPEMALSVLQKGIKAYHELRSKQRNERRDDYAKLCASAARCLLKKSPTDADMAEALELFRESVAIDPDNADNWYRLGSVQLEKGKIDEAFESLQKAESLAPKKDYVIHRLAQIHLKKQNPAEALATYERIASHRRVPYILHGMAQCDLALGRAEEAARKLYRATQLEPSKFYHHWDFGCTLEQLGATKQALEAFEAANREFRREYGGDYRKAEDKIKNLRAAAGESKTIVFEERHAEVPQINSGRVTKYNSQRGFGFIRDDSDGKDIFFHISAIKGRSEPAIGARVRYVREQGQKGPQATKVSRV
jgi:tetratricopeptide (TPR) repeat protein/cold shock CspA family protein